LFLLGFPRVQHAGLPVKIERRKAIALLAYLVVTGNSQSRDALAALFWPDREPSRAYAYLRNTLWVLNQTPVAKWLEVNRKTVGLRSKADLWLDMDLFHSHLAACQTHDHPGYEVCVDCVPLLTKAVNLYQGDFMAGFSLSDSATFDEWQFFETEALRQELAGALAKLVRFYGTQEAFEPAIVHARRWSALNPLDESVQRHLMTLYAQSGQRAAALRQYEECVRALGDDLGIAPSEETVELYERIRTGKLDPAKRYSGETAPSHNLPAQPTPFVGRETELAEIHRLLRDPECHLLTIVGLGGSGKTRLALQAAVQTVNEWENAFPDGVFFVPLAPVSASEFIVPTIADALHAPFSPTGAETPQAFQRADQALHAQFLDYVREKRMLIVLDNVEHLLSPACEEKERGADLLIADVLCRAPGVKLLVTSRERLNLRSEWVLEIAGLRFPTPEEETAANAVETYGAVQLFLQSARRTDVGFAPTATDLAAVARICQLVEGVPLGIELAAAWVKVLSCQEIATEIEANLDFLTASLRDVPERHQSLRAVFVQSWALLLGDGRACFRKLSVFRGGFTREAARDVGGASLAALSSLVDKSLLRRTSIGRYEMLEVLRQYAEERLGIVPREGDVVRDRHCDHYFALLRHLEPSLKGAEQKAALDTLSREVENIRAAWRWAIARDKVAEIREIAWSLFLFYDIRNRFQEGAEMFREAATALDTRDVSLSATQNDTDSTEVRRALLGFLYVVYGWFLHFFAPDESRAILQRGMAHLEPLGLRKELALANILSLYADSWSPSGLAQRVRDSLAFFEASDDLWGIALASDALSYTLCPEDYAAAERYAQQSLELRRQLGDQWGMALALFTLGWIAEYQGMWQVAKRRFHESMELRRAIREDRAGIMDCLSSMGRVAHRMEDYEEARRLYLEAQALAHEIGHRWRIACVLENLGMVAYDLKEYTEAKCYLEECLALYQDVGAKERVASVTAAIGNLS
jgi:predicted ATPase/DNA-binding SARP family transcriptional activator